MNEIREAQKTINDYNDVSWTEMHDVTSAKNPLTNLFDNFFGWVNDSLDSRYVTIDEQRAQMLLENPDLDITNLSDGFDLEVARLNAIQQKSSRGFTIIDINPSLLVPDQYGINIPYEFLFDGTNYIPDQDGSIAKNFRSIPLDIAGNFVKVEYIYENNSDANIGSSTNLPENRPYANIKYTQALKNTTTVNGQIIYSENDLLTGYRDYYFDNFARNKVFIGFGDNVQKPHIVSKSGDYFETYFNALNITVNIGCPKIRITVGFNSKKFDGPSNDAINSRLHLMGSGRLFSTIDTPLSPFNIQIGDIIDTYEPSGLVLLSQPARSATSLSLVYNKGYVNPQAARVSLGYSILFINQISFTINRTQAANAYAQMNIFVGTSTNPADGNTVRLWGGKLDLINGNTQESNQFNLSFSDPIRVVIPSNCGMFTTIYYQSNNVINLLVSYSITGYSLGGLEKVLVGGGPGVIINTTKYVTDSTFLNDYNRRDAIRDGI